VTLNYKEFAPTALPETEMRPEINIVALFSCFTDAESSKNVTRI
jgi:hypothetical protein